MAKSFSATVGDWGRKSLKRQKAVFHASAMDIVDETSKTTSRGGNMRVKTGFLRASLQASDSAMPQIDDNARPAVGGQYGSPSEQTTLVILNTELGKTLYLGYTASYARYREFKDGFVRGAAKQWQNIVKRNVAKAKRTIR